MYKMYDNKKLVLEKHLRNNVSAFQSINNKKERIRRDAMQWKCHATYKPTTLYPHDTPGSPTPTGSEFKNQDAKVQKIFLFVFV